MCNETIGAYHWCVTVMFAEKLEVTAYTIILGGDGYYLCVLIYEKETVKYVDKGEKENIIGDNEERMRIKRTLAWHDYHCNMLDSKGFNE